MVIARHSHPREVRHFLRPPLLLPPLQGVRTGRSVVHHVVEARDGTRKFLLQLFDGRVVEAVGIPADDSERPRLTVCVSSQVCPRGSSNGARASRVLRLVSPMLFAAHSTVVGSLLDKLSLPQCAIWRAGFVAPAEFRGERDTGAWVSLRRVEAWLMLEGQGCFVHSNGV